MREFRSKKGDEFDEKRCLGEPKWSQNQSKIDPKWVQMATWSNIEDSKPKKG